MQFAHVTRKGQQAKVQRRQWLATVLAGALCATPAAWAAKPGTEPKATAAWPTQPVTLVIGFAKGSVSEVLASQLVGPLSQALGQPVLVELVIGKGGALAAAKVAQSKDGHTIGIVMSNTLTVAKMVDPTLPYDPDRDLRPLAFSSDDPMVLVGLASEPSATSQDFLTAARNAGAKWTYGSQGNGSLGHLGMEYLELRGGVHAQHLAFTGGPEVVEAMRAGKVQLAMLPATLAKRNATPQGPIKPVAVTSYARTDVLPNVPTLHELGVRGFDYRAWSAIVVPHTWPEAQAAQLNAVIDKLLDDPQVVQKLAQAGVNVPKDSSATRARREIAQETRLLGGIAAIQGVKAPAKP